MSDDTENSEASEVSSVNYYGSESMSESTERTTTDESQNVQIIDDASSEEATVSDYESTMSGPTLNSGQNIGGNNGNVGEHNSQGQQVINEPMEGAVIEVPLANVEQDSLVIRSQRNNANRNDTSDTQDENIKPPNSTKKRKRPNRIISDDEFDDDDGMTCPICLDHWDMSGTHRLVSLKCGHLFGDSCIRRWLRECPTGNKLCPHCKTKAFPRDIRHLYARKAVVLDNSETIRLQKELDEERQKVTSLQMELQMARMEHKIQQNLICNLQQQIAQAQLAASSTSAKLSTARNGMYKLFMEKNIEITQQPGCRVLAFSRNKHLLLASQKSSTTIFPGYGVRFIDLPSFRPSNYLHLSPNSVRDMCFDYDEDVLVAATGERTCRLYNVNTRNSIETLTPSENSQVWSCGFDRSRTKFLYLGSQNGSIYVYDTRQPRNYLKEHKTPGDISPVLNVWSVPSTETTPFGGFLVCKLISCWFFEYTNDHNTIANRLNINGPFLSMQYDFQSHHALINTRPSANQPTTRHILADITKLNNTTASLQIINEFHGSKIQSQISRSSQINLRNNVVVAAYCEDAKILQTWSSNNGGTKMHSLSVNEKILDTCPIYLSDDTHLAALTENKCRVYKFVEES